MPFDLISNPVSGAEVGPAPAAAIWAGPCGGHSDCSPQYRQVTDDDPGHNYIAGAGITAARAGEPDSADFIAEFPDAKPGLLHGILYISWGYSYATIYDMYSADERSTRAYSDASSYTYSNNYIYVKKLLLPKVSTGGMWYIPFAKPIPFYLGLRVGYDNGSCFMYFLYSLGVD